jgi:hypothetical protein
MTKKNVKHLQHSIYWIKYKDVPQDIFKDGYVGCCVDLPKRIGEHRRAGKYLTSDTELIVIASGSYDSMYELEAMLRPYPSIGWNERGGGLYGKPSKAMTEKNKQTNKIAQTGVNNGMYGKRHSDETRAKQRKPKSEEHKQSLKIRSQNPDYLAKLRKPKPKEVCVDCGKIRTRNIFVRYYQDCMPYLQTT